MKKNITLIFLTLSISFTTFSQTMKNKEIKIPTVEYRQGIYYLELESNTSYERGYQHGAALKFVIKKSLKNFENWITENTTIKIPEEAISEFTNNNRYIQSVKVQLPELFNEFQGIVDGAQVNFDKLFAYQSFDEFYSYLEAGNHFKTNEGNCTTTGVFGRKNKANFLTHNNDLPNYHEDAVTILKIKYPNSDLVILQQTFAGQIGQNGVNNYGVAVGINTIIDLPISNKGIPVSFNIRKILESKNSSDALEYLKKVNFGTSMNYLIADREIAISVETWEDNIEVIHNKKQHYIAHTNHTLQENAPVIYDIDADANDSSFGHTHGRLNLANEVLEDKANNIDFEGLQNLKTTRPILNSSTIMGTIISIPKKGFPILWTTGGSPDIFHHVKFTF
ncbi:C45 family autoproteolytic acyltransferase/hydolase [Ulvibacter antarcticus]|uniref:Acyl-CoA:6-aminopenicillanic acid acyl transferase n=1 Tax=Ulvibacter antarcticus TaxID=442714 RepID=A0A3L9Y9U0_9FLAO|nr:C45 family peptidase [Ulvibacter antarcticus]RMA56287.1 acyl-CoA:6-aminopenicillanic acid acyl transferase [Ulvibacter antarcticus]